MIINDTIFNCELSDVLNEIDAQRSLYGLSPFTKRRDSGNDIQVCCPYHIERRPSAGIRKSDGLFHCFACQETHTLPELISYVFEKRDDILGAFGWSWLLKNFASVEVENRKPIELNITRGQKEKKEQTYVSEEELDSYRYTHPYMYKRRLTDEIIELFDIGFDKDSQSITFPIRDINGNCLFIARRSVKTKFFSYPQGVEKPLYGLYELYKDGVTGIKFSSTHILDYPIAFPKEIIICESMFDALTCWVYGKYAVALNGLGNDLQFKQLRELPCRKFILATDMDERGVSARQRIRKNIRRNKIVTEYVWDVNVAKDINDMDEEMFNSLEEIF